MTDPIDHGAARQNTSPRPDARAAAKREAEKRPAKFVEPEEEGVDSLPFKTWTREEAEALRARRPPLSPWRVVVAQAVAGLLCFAVAQAVFQRGGVAWSVLYGATVTVLPAALLARGLTRNPSPAPGAAVFGFMFWEMVKIGVAVAMLLAAPSVVPDLSWPALLVAMVVCMKVNWLALLWQRRAPVNVVATNNLKT